MYGKKKELRKELEKVTHSGKYRNSLKGNRNRGRRGISILKLWNWEIVDGTTETFGGVDQISDSREYKDVTVVVTSNDECLKLVL